MLACLAQSVGVRLCWIPIHLTKKNLFIYLFILKDRIDFIDKWEYYGKNEVESSKDINIIDSVRFVLTKPLYVKPFIHLGL